jgi:hypothetical protein
MPKTKVFTVDSVQLSIASVTGRVRVQALGKARTSGWTDAELIDTPRPPADGNIHLDFVATKPTGIVLQVITPIGAERTIQGVQAMSASWFTPKPAKSENASK